MCPHITLNQAPAGSSEGQSGPGRPKRSGVLETVLGCVSGRQGGG